MEQTGGNQMAIVCRFYSLMHHHAMQNVAPNHGDLQRVLVIVVKRVAHGQTLDDAPRRRAYALRLIVARGTKNPAKIPGEEIAKLVCRDRCDCFHSRSPNDVGWTAQHSPSAHGVRGWHFSREMTPLVCLQKWLYRMFQDLSYAHA
jgi:hypothetical protein